MNRNFCLTALGVLSPFVVASAGAAPITWAGGTGDFLTGANWTGGSAPTLDGTDDAIINAGDVTYTPGGDFGQGWAGSSITVSGGSLEQTVTNWWQFNGSGTFTVNGGDVTTNAGNVIFGTSGTDTASLVMSSGSFTHTGGEVKVRGGNTATITGGTLTVNFFSIGDFGNATIDVSGGTVILSDGAASFNGIYNTGASYIDVTGTGVFNVGNINVADATVAYLDSDKVRSGGDTNNALLQVLDDGNGGVNISVVPEPGSLALIALGGLLIARRRRD